MKKIISILSALALAAAGLVMTGCGDDGELLGTNVWYTDSYEVTEGNTLTVYYYYSQTEVTDFTDTGMRSDITSLPAGLTMVFYNSSASTIAGLANNYFVMKTIGIDETVEDTDNPDTDDDESSGSSLTMSDAKWTAIYAYNLINKKSVIKSATQAVPTVLRNDVKNTFTTAEWDTIKSNLSWKKILAQILLS